MSYGNHLAAGTTLGYFGYMLMLSQSNIPLSAVVPSLSATVLPAAALPWTLGLLAALWIGMNLPKNTNEEEQEQRTQMVPAYR
jgi:hypothetical protein